LRVQRRRAGSEAVGVERAIQAKRGARDELFGDAQAKFVIVDARSCDAGADGAEWVESRNGTSERLNKFRAVMTGSKTLLAASMAVLEMAGL